MSWCQRDLWYQVAAWFAACSLDSGTLHSHAKDTFINKPVAALTNRHENGTLTNIPVPAWSYITLGYGNGQTFWKDFCYRLRMVGYDGWLFIAHENVMLSREEGVKKSVEASCALTSLETSDYKLQEFLPSRSPPSLLSGEQGACWG